jgi:two-component SAPR family response regulator
MPHMNGYEFVKKAKEIDKQIKILLMSAFGIKDKEFHNIYSIDYAACKVISYSNLQAS